MGAEETAFYQAGLGGLVKPRLKPHMSDNNDCRLAPAPAEEAAGGCGVGHHGEPEEEEESIVVEEPGGPSVGPAKVVKAPRVPTQAEIDAHVATHLPHAYWCDVCARRRGRNAPHRQKELHL